MYLFGNELKQSPLGRVTQLIPLGLGDAQAVDVGSFKDEAGHVLGADSGTHWGMP